MFGWIARLINGAVALVPAPIRNLIHDAITGVFGFIHTIFGLVISAWNDLYRAAKDLVAGVEAFVHEVGLGFHQIFAVWIPAYIKWVNNNIVKPLTTAVHWIEHEGATIWYYLTHPAALVDLIWNNLLVKMETEAWTAGEKLGEFFLSLIVHNLARFLKLIETIVDAVL